jgi:feruloyl esterase
MKIFDLLSSRIKSLSMWGTIAVLPVVLVACGGDIFFRSDDCRALMDFKILSSQISLPTNGAKITAATYVGESDAGNTNGNYCKLMGLISPVDKTAPDIKFQVNIPKDWNQKAVQFGGGGYNGSIPNTLAWTTLGLKNIETPLKQGYVTFASDSGHQAPNSDDASFALNDESLLNYGYMHIKKTRDVMVSLTKAFQGQEPRRIYFQGGSTGGREALTAAMRWPESYDGVLPNYPTANFMGLRLWGVALGRAIYDNNSAGWIPPVMVNKIASLANSRCDSLDGVVDGLVSNMTACRAQSDKMIQELACKNGETGYPENCLTLVQISKTLDVYHNGFTLPYSFVNGVNNYLGYNSQEGITMQIGSQPGYIEPPVSGPNAHHVSRADQFVKYFVARDPNFNLLSLDIQNPGKWKDRIISLSDILGATTPDWSAFEAKGGKVLWVQGNDDPSVSPYANIAVYNSIVKKMGQDKVSGFMKLYLVPGLAHGGGKFSPVWDNLNALDKWVEKGIAPTNQVTFDGTTTITKDRSRPLCEYPTWSKYNGTGDINLAANYSCSK